MQDFRDIHIPEAIGWWPPAVGWWLLMLLVLLIALGYGWYRYRQRPTALSVAAALLAEIKTDASRDNLARLKALSELVRRVAISTDTRKQAAGLIGQQWLVYLDQTLTHTPFQNDIGRLLTEAPYRQQAPSESELNELIIVCENWLKHGAKRKS